MRNDEISVFTLFSEKIPDIQVKLRLGEVPAQGYGLLIRDPETQAQLPPFK